MVLESCVDDDKKRRLFGYCTQTHTHVYAHTHTHHAHYAKSKATLTRATHAYYFTYHIISYIYYLSYCYTFITSIVEECASVCACASVGVLKGGEKIGGKVDWPIITSLLYRGRETDATILFLFLLISHVCPLLLLFCIFYVLLRFVLIYCGVHMLQ